jgi:hypothetical protein
LHNSVEDQQPKEISEKKQRSALTGKIAQMHSLPVDQLKLPEPEKDKVTKKEPKKKSTPIG